MWHIYENFQGREICIREDISILFSLSTAHAVHIIFEVIKILPVLTIRLSTHISFKFSHSAEREAVSDLLYREEKRATYRLNNLPQNLATSK